MARITVEDCLKKIPNRFQMVLVASVRARQLSQGHTPRLRNAQRYKIIEVICTVGVRLAAEPRFVFW